MADMSEAMGRVKACHECRQQKVRCDAYKDYSQPCSRCKAAGVPCVVSAKFQRSKRQTKAQLQYEVDQLRSRLQGRSQSEDDSSAVNAWSQDRSPSNVSASLAVQLQQESGELSRSPSLGGTSAGQHRPSVTSESTVYSNTSTNDQVLRDFSLEGRKIDDCYLLFKTHYAGYLEGLFSDTPSPNEVYQQSPLLFWAITYVGARRYKKDLTVHSSLGPLVIELAFTTIGSPNRALPTILAAIVICSWPPPVDLVFKDPCPALAGAALNLAIQNGLHMHRREQDFVNKSRKRSSYTVSSPSTDVLPFASGIGDPAVVYRIRVWAHCVVTFQSSSLCEGLPPLAVPFYREDERCKMLRSVLPDELTYRVRIHRVQIEASHAISNGLDPEDNSTDNVLTTTIHSFDERLKENYYQTGNDYQYLVQTSARLWNLAMLFVTTVNDNGFNMLHLYRVARDLILHVSNQEQHSPESTSYLPHYFSRTIFTAAHCILRIYRSPLRQRLDINETETSFFTAVDLLKKISVLTNDLDARNSVILPQLWSSNRVFVRANGIQNGLYLDLRDRLGASAAFDNFWWWRAHFGNIRTAEEVMDDVNAPIRPHGRVSDISQPESDQTQMAIRIPEMGEGQIMENLTIPEDNIHGLWDWDMMMVENDLLPWANWPIAGYDYSSIEATTDISTAIIPAQYRTS